MRREPRTSRTAVPHACAPSRPRGPLYVLPPVTLPRSRSWRAARRLCGRGTPRHRNPMSARSGDVTSDDRTYYRGTYGCQMNVADSEVIASVLARAGYRAVEQPREADVVLLNT